MVALKDAKEKVCGEFAKRFIKQRARLQTLKIRRSSRAYLRKIRRRALNQTIFFIKWLNSCK